MNASYDCHSSYEATLKNMDWKLLISNHNKARPVCIFLGMYSVSALYSMMFLLIYVGKRYHKPHNQHEFRGADAAVLCAKFPNGWKTKTDVMD